MFDPVEAVKELVRFPSVSTDSSSHEGMEGARRSLGTLLTGMGFEVEVVETPLHPVLLASRGGEPDWPHVIIYGHYDVQPADPLELWDSPAFEPEVREGFLFGRGTADNKGPLMVHIAAVARFLEKHPDAPLRITFLIEGEEEIGSPSFGGFLERYKDRLAGDFVLLSDTQSPSPEQITITTGLRGIICLDVELTGPKMDLHSGVHGGVVLNPIHALCGLCNSLYTPEGHINVPGFYDDVLPVYEWEREELQRLGLEESDYSDFLGVSRFHAPEDASPFAAIRFHPSLDFNGIWGGYQGEGSKTVIPSKAFVKISCRLVPDQKPIAIQKLFIETLQKRCPPQVSLNIIPGHSGAPYLVAPPDKPNTPKDQSPILAKAFKAADQAIEEVYGKRPLYLREGGSIPIIADLKKVLGLDSIMLGMCTQESNIHAPNENLHLGMFQNGINASEKILNTLAGL